MASLLLVPRDHLTGHPATEAAYLALAEARADRRGRQIIEDSRSLVAYVSQGLWVADCPHCAAGVAIDPEWQFAACFGLGCHRVYRSIVVPTEWRDIETALSVRPRINQHWFDAETRTRRQGHGVRILRGETVEDLLRENLAHGLVRRP